LRVLQVISNPSQVTGFGIVHQRKGKLRKHQRVWNLIQQRRVSSIIGSLSIIALLGVFLGPAQVTYNKTGQALSQPACISCASYLLSKNTGTKYEEPFVSISRQVQSVSKGGIPTYRASVPNTPTHSRPVKSTPTKSAPTPLPTQGSRNIFPYGSCTWWANQRYFQLHGIFVPWRTQSNAWQWTARAYQFGWHVSGSPVVGDIIDLQPGVQGASSWGGHVAVVERILSNGHVIASNMSWGAHPWQITYVEFAPGPGVTFIYR
jgi:N-acetylmuramoyl-L-alanine amidase